MCLEYHRGITYRFSAQPFRFLLILTIDQEWMVNQSGKLYDSQRYTSNVRYRTPLKIDASELIRLTVNMIITDSWKLSQEKEECERV